MQRTLLLVAHLLVPLFAIGCTPTGAQSNGSSASSGGAAKPNVKLLNVSYDPTREFYQEFNDLFAGHWAKEHSQTVTIEQSHGGSGKQVRAVSDGLEADVVTLALANDLDILAGKGLLTPAWQERLPHNSSPYTSTIVFLVRKSNPKRIKDWGDLVQEGVEIITPNPKTSGGARWNYLAAWGFALKRELGDLKKLDDPNAAEEVTAAKAKAREFVTQIYRRVPVLDSGARGSTNTFVKREIGDVLLAWENEAFLAVKEAGPDTVEIVVPSVSILAEPPVSIVDKIADKHGTREVAEGYLQHLYSAEGQQLAAKHFFRPSLPDLISEEQRQQFADVELFTVNQVFGGWSKAQPEHFDDGGEFDKIFK